MKSVRSLTAIALAFAVIGLMLGVQPETAKAQSIADRIKKAVEDAQKKGQPQQKAPQPTPQPNGTPAPAGQQTSAPQSSRQNAPNAKASAAIDGEGRCASYLTRNRYSR